MVIGIVCLTMVVAMIIINFFMTITIIIIEKYYPRKYNQIQVQRLKPEKIDIGATDPKSAVDSVGNLLLIILET